MDIGDAKLTIEAVDKASATIDDIAQRMTELGAEGIEAAQHVNQAMDQVGAKTKETSILTSKNLRIVGQYVAAIEAAAIAVAVVVSDAVKDWAEFGDAINNMAIRTGFGVESLSELDYIAKRSGTTLASVETATKKLSSAIIVSEDAVAAYQKALVGLTPGTDEYKKALAEVNERIEASTLNFQRLGLDIAALRAMSPEQQFWTVAMALAELEDVTLRTAIATDLFGSSGTDLLPMLAEGAAGIQAQRDRAHELGVTLTDESVVAAKDFSTAMVDLNAAITGVKYALAEELGPALTDIITNQILPAIIDFATFIKNNEEFAQTFIDMARGIAEVIKWLLELFVWLHKIDEATPDWLARFSPLSLLTGRTGREMGEEFRGTTELPGLIPGIEEAFGAQATSMLGGATVNTTVNINGNVMGDDASIRQLASVVGAAIMEGNRGTTFSPINQGYFPGSTGP